MKINLLINGKEKIFESVHDDVPFETLAQVLKQLPLSTVFAIAVNKIFVPQTQYELTQMKSGDEIEIISPHPGG